MKRLLLSLISMLVIGSAWADDDSIVLSIPNVEVPQGGSVQVPINITNTIGVKSFQADITLNGINLNIGDIQMSDLVLADRTSNIAYKYWVDEDGNEYNEYDETKILTEKTGITEFTVESNYPEVDGYKAFRFLGFNMKSVFMSGTEGAAAYFTIAASDNVEIGKTYTAKIVSASGSSTGSSIVIPDQSFTITVVENRVILDENSTEVPGTYTNQNVKVLRTINADEWSTICLPFAMTADQVKTVFGEKALFADFTGYEATFDGSNVTAIDVKFSSFDGTTSGLAANYPYLIKISKAITEFEVDNVNVEPATYPFVSGTTGQRICEMYGIYAKTENFGSNRSPYLFISGNKFYYATGKTTIKAFRGYFDFLDVISDMSQGASAKIGFSVDDVADGIDSLRTSIPAEGIYDLSGRKIKLEGDDLSRLPKGVYIVDGKKVTVK